MEKAEYHEDSFDNEYLHCTQCGWKGLGSDTVIIDFYGLGKGLEIHCPICDIKLGIVKKDDVSPGGTSSDSAFQA